MNAHTTTIAAACPVTIGQALYAEAIGLHWVASIERDDSGARLLIGGPSPMSPIRWRVVAVTSDARRFQIDEHIAAERAKRGANYPARDDTAELLARADAAQQASRVAALRDAEEGERQRAAAREEVARYRPSWATHAIVAELDEDKSDTMTDYHGHITVKTVVLGWSRHGRDLFPELRKAAATYPETAHLATADEKAEHREKYSMGAGYYLKAGWRDSSGWGVRKVSADGLAARGLEFSDAAKGVAPAPAASAPKAPGAGLFSIEEHTHTKKGFQMHIATMAERVDRARYDELLSAARALGGWYSKPWAGTPGGFAFKSADAARQFVTEAQGDEPAAGAAQDRPATAAPRAPAVSRPEKLRALADSMQAKVDDCFRERDSNTPRKARMAACARLDGMRWQRAQRIARALADRIEAGDCPAALFRVSTKAELFDLAAEALDTSGGYYDAPRALGRPLDWRDAAKDARAAEAWALLSADPEQAKAEELRRKLDALRFSNIEGYFPTPAGLVAQMIERADLREGAEVLEPSAGSGAIADAVRDAGFTVHCIERHASLCEVLRLKGHDVTQGDFMDVAGTPLFDAVIMNPPFERGQDCEHVLRAFREHLRPGGTLVAIMGAGVKFRGTRPYLPFRDWLDEQAGEMIDIPAGAFKESGTGVASVMVVVTKGEA